MRTLRHLVAAVLIIGLTSSSAFAQQRHVVDSASLAGAVRQHAAAQEQDRTVLHDTLARPDVQRAASAAGIDLNRIGASVDTMSADDAARAAAAARDVTQALDQSMVGGASTVTISTTTIIIGLLVLILLIVALD